MTKTEFIEALKNELEKNQISNINEIVSDYFEHFTHGLSAGKTESEIAASLGNPETIAKAYHTDKMIKDIRNPNKEFRVGIALRVLFRLILLAPFNFLVLFIPGAIIFALLLAGWAVSFAFGSIGIAIIALLSKVTLVSASAWAAIAGISSALAIIGLSVIGVIVMLIVSKAFLMMAISYLQWNLKFITEK